ncbi:thioredoxin domain-containing protein [Pajaroellobacter abortibovis]|uniref:Vitamin K epoxide reductase domain-containing protein n=1 Tax=Pajaroellobacter abortibovis TaxID=1882918 RepID=A0A1L6MYT3_9BACT|nr:thioredoxin domain-containing protein [Pajaroellobacter abortibovis]APS00617.1 hypothetical protein BCY86_07985 [Pajaroellobacter abortibovis]
MGSQFFKTTVSLLVILLILGTGFSSSLALLIDYQSAVPTFCSLGSGCDALRLSRFAYWGGIPTPLAGVLLFFLLSLSTLLPGNSMRRWMLLLSVPAACCAFFLIAVQFVWGHFCPYCLVIDGAICVLCIIAVFRFFKKIDFIDTKKRGILALSFLMVVGCAPLALKKIKGPQIPGPINREIEQTPPGQVTVIDFLDFECPFCRLTHEALSAVLLNHKQDLRIVRKQVPLTRIHPHSLIAARAACCGETMGRGEEMTHALFRAPISELTAEGCQRIAAAVGMDTEAFRICLNDALIDQRLEQDRKDFEDSEGRGLPTLWVSGEKLEGLQSEARLEKIITMAIQRVRRH